MADLIAGAIVVTNLVSSSGAVRIQTFGGTQPNQFLVQDFELTAAQNAALSTALAAAAGTVTTTQVPAGPAILPGIYNAV
jgi:hypothetical protein